MTQTIQEIIGWKDVKQLEENAIKNNNIELNKILKKIRDRLKSWEKINDKEKKAAINFIESLKFIKAETKIDLSNLKDEMNICMEIKNQLNRLEQDISWKQESAGKLFTSNEKNKWQTMKQFIKENWHNNFIIDFSNNKSAEYNIWLADLLSEEVTKVRVIWEKNGKKYDMIWTRQWLKGWFYNEQWRYLPVFNWFKVEILWSYKKEELVIKKQENEQKIKEIVNLPLVKNFEKKHGNEQLTVIVKKAQEYGIDPTFLLALRSTENGRDWLDFWIMKWWIDTFEWQLVMSCRTIQNNMNRFKRITWENAIWWDWIFKPEFIGFFSNIYAPIWVSNDPNNLNKNHFTNLLTFYSNYSWKNFGNIDTIIAQNTAFYKKWETKINSWEITWATTPDDLIANANKHIGKEYKWWWWRKTDSVTDCSWLVLMSMKDSWVVDYWYDNTAAWLSKITNQKPANDVKRWDLVFLKDPTPKNWRIITHVEIATWPVVDGKIPIIDASSWRWVTERYQPISDKVLVWTPIFYT